MSRSRWFFDSTPTDHGHVERVPYPERTFGIEDHGVELDQDYPMDAFDQQLLARCEGGGFERSRQIPERVSFPSRAANAMNHLSGQQSLRDDLLDIRQLPASSSSPIFPISSPIVSALQNRSQVSQRSHPVSRNQRHAFPRAPKRDIIPAHPQPTTISRLPARTYGLPQTPPIVQGIPLISTDRLPDHLRSVFKFELFNAVQSKCFSTAFETNDNMVLSAPTGSGKTVIMELAILRLLVLNKTRDFKIVYQAPTKSLCSERYRDWTAKFGTLGLQCAELTGDAEYTHLRSVQSAHIIVTTPEKWDSVTRKWRDNAKLMQMIKIFLVDEVHILNESRGAALEAIVSRMKTAGSGVRFIALSATVPNSNDIATWLGKCPTAQHIPAHREVFDETFRPTTLEKHVVGFNCRPNEFALDSLLTKEVPSLVARYAKRKPVMIFCVTKNSAAKMAHTLAELWFSTTEHLRLWNAPKRQVRVIDQDLKKLIPAGVAFHHGGLDVADRHAVEQGFLQGDVNIICSTSTLAVGVNLPCYLVILKGTSCWSDKGLQEYSSLEVMQMLGRAGRPQFEISACAVILTHSEKVRRYEEMVSGQEILESFLHENLIEHLNAEIGIGTIRDMASAKKWLASSFLSVRLRQNPDHYRLQGQVRNDDADYLLEQICERDLNLLEKATLIEQRHGFRCTEYGDAMARYYIRYETMLVFLSMPQKSRISEILNILAQAQEFSDVKVRSGEKSMYKQMNQANDIRYPIKVDIALPVHKTSLIVQAQLGGVTVDKSNAKHAAQLKQDTLMVVNHCGRLIRCIIDIQIHRQDAVGVRNALELCRSIAAGVWDNTPMQLKQIESIGDVTARRLASAGINSVDTLLTTEPHRIEVVLGKSQPFGSVLLQKAAKFPNLHITVKEIGRIEKGSSGGVEIQLKCDIGHFNDCLPAFFNRKGVYICFLCETSYGKLVDFRRFGAKRLQSGDEILLTVLLDRQCSFIRCHVMCDEIAGTNRFAELKLQLPNTLFPSEAPSAEILVDPVPEASAVPHRVDAFDDGDLADEDFLAVETDIGCVEEIQGDIDVILASTKQTTGLTNNLKRKLPAVSSAPAKSMENNSTASKPFREPTRLANGNWTCQHTCNEDGKNCKHICCQDGVKKPKKCVNSQATIAKKNNRIESAFTKPCVEAKRSEDKIYDIDEILQNVAKYRDAAYLHRASSMGHSSEPQGKKLCLEDENTLVARGNDVDEFGSDGWPSARKIIAAPTDSRMKGGRDTQDETPATKQKTLYDVDDFDIDLHDCDWTLNKDATSDLQSGQFSQNTVSRCCFERENAQYDSARSTSTDNTEIGDKTCASVSKPASDDQTAALEEVHDHRFEDGFYCFDDIDDTEIVALSETIVSGPSEPAQAGLEPLSSSGAVQDSDDQPITISTSGEPSKLYQGVQNNEIEEDRKKKLHEEDQKRRWAKFPAWMFEEFGSCVDIVDE